MSEMDERDDRFFDKGDRVKYSRGFLNAMKGHQDEYYAARAGRVDRSGYKTMIPVFWDDSLIGVQMIHFSNLEKIEEDRA